MKKIIRILLPILVICIALGSFSSCSTEGEVLMSFADKSMSVNTYTLLLSRMKGTLESYGYDVDNPSFWKTIISADGMTYDDSFSPGVMEQASRYLIADYLFDRNGLVLTEEREKTVDELMSAFVKRAGSKTALNAELKEYGVNYEMLRRLYLQETRIDMLKDHLYGEKGELIPAETCESYLRENYVAFGQIFFASYYYLVDLDEFGDQVYYTNEKHTAISYDKVNGRTAMDEFGETVTDILGDPVYYNEEGRIAYDKRNGVLGYVTDDDGNQIIDYYDDEKKGQIYEKAALCAEACDGDADTFRSNALLYDESESGGECMYLYNGSGYYGSQSESVAYLDEIAETLAEMEVGECRVVDSDFGYHVICRYEMTEGVYDDEEQKDVFSDFYDDLIQALFDEECKGYESALELSEKGLEAVPSMAEVASNILY